MRLYGTPGEVRNASEDFDKKASGATIEQFSVSSINVLTGLDSTVEIIVSSAIAGEKVIYTFNAPAIGAKHQILIGATTDAGETLNGDSLLLGVSPKFAELQSALAGRIQDDAGKLSQNDADDCIWEAITGRYSSVRPVNRVASFDGDGVTWQWPLADAGGDDPGFAGWIEGFSVVIDLEYPAGERVPQILAKDDWNIYQLDQQRELRLPEITPATGKTLRVRYTAPHSEDGSDIPATDFNGLASLAGSLAALRLAAAYNQLGDSALSADAVNYGSKTTEYRAIARELEKKFRLAFGLDSDAEIPAASSTASWKNDTEDEGRNLTH